MAFGARINYGNSLENFGKFDRFVGKIWYTNI